METIITLVFVHNILLFSFLGTDLLVEGKLKEKSVFVVMLVSILVTIVVSFLNFQANQYLIQKFNLGYATTFIFSVNIVLAAILVDFIFKKFIGIFYQKSQELIQTIAFSTLVFGVALFNFTNQKTLSSYMCSNLLLVLGFVLVYYLLNTMRQKTAYNKFPKYVYPMPIIFVLLGILSMAFKGFANAFY